MGATERWMQWSTTEEDRKENLDTKPTYFYPFIVITFFKSVISIFQTPLLTYTFVFQGRFVLFFPSLF